MFSWLKSRPDSEPVSRVERLSASETIEARLVDIEARMARMERRWSPGDQRGLDEALANLRRAVTRETDRAA